MHLIETTETTYRFAGGIELPRITSILSLVRPDLATIPAYVLARAAARGRAVHRAVWILVGGDPSGLKWDSVHPDCLPYLDAWAAFAKETGVVVLDKERLVPSERYRNCGRLDLLVAGLSTPSSSDVVDIKTTAEEHAAHELQCTAYAANWQECTGTRRTPGRWRLYLRGDGTYRLRRCMNRLEVDLKVFLSIQQAFLWVQAHQNGRS